MEQLTLLAGIGHWIMADVDWALLGSLLVGSVPGIVIGSLLAATLVLVGGRLLG